MAKKCPSKKKGTDNSEFNLLRNSLFHKELQREPADGFEPTTC
ncbi:MAG: hypothetical protein JWL90_4065 [Chthoniobacteraceae bacterium]|nr:hypothetical protein [Chthoniobacteraceae bacterium]